MSDQNGRVTLQPHSVGELLTEVSRAHLHCGLPSATLQRLRDGVAQFILETTNPDERTLATQLVKELGEMIQEWQKKEIQHFSM